MLTLTEAAIRVVGAEACETLQVIDTAYATNLRLAADAIEAIKSSGLPAIQGQRLVEGFNDGFEKAAIWRRSVTSSIARLQIIHKRSDQAEIDGGCPVPWFADFFVTGQDDAAQEDVLPPVSA